MPTREFRQSQPAEAGYGMARPKKGWEDKEPAESPSAKKELDPRVVEAMELGQNFIDRYQELFYTIARDRSIRFEVGSGFYIDLKGGKVSLDVRDFMEMREEGFSEYQILWSVLHELSHYYDLRENPDEMLKHFKYLESRAADLAPQVLDIWKQKAGGELPAYLTKKVRFGSEGKRTVPWVNAFLYRKLHLLYNSLDDMHVNGTLGLRSAIFGKGGSQESEVTRLYRDYLFATDPKQKWQEPQPGQATDYASLPKSYQLAYAVLRERMVPSQSILLSERVTGVLDGYADEDAERYGITLRAEIEAITKLEKKQALDPGWRYQQIQGAVEPAFLKLMFEDLEEQEIPKPPKPGGEGGEPGGESGGESGPPGDEGGENGEGGPGDEGEEGKSGENEAESGSAGGTWDELDKKPEPLDLDTVKDYINQKKQEERDRKIREVKEEREARLTPSERAAKAEAESDLEISRKFDVDPAFAREYRELERSVADYKRELALVFEQFMQTIEERMRQFWVTGFKSGKFNVDRFVRKHGPELVTGSANIDWQALDIYDRRDFFSRFVLYPNEFRIRLVIDGSGSMNEAKVLAVKRAYVLFEEAMSVFRESINLRFRMNEPVKTGIDVHVFGSVGDSRLVKDTGENASAQEQIAMRFRALGKINSNYGKTCDAEAVWNVAKRYGPEMQEKLKNNRAVDIMIEMTDGGSNLVSKVAPQLLVGVSEEGNVTFKGQEVGVNMRAMQDLRNAVKAVEDAGGIARALLMGSEEELEISDQAQFAHVWGKDGRRAETAADIPQVLAGMLKEEIQKLQARLAFYEVEDTDIDEGDGA